MHKTLWGLGKPLFAFLILISMQNALAQTDLLNLNDYAEGASLPYGENLIVGMVEKTGDKYITGEPSSLGRFKFPVKLTGDFEVSFKAFEDYCCTEYFDFFLTTGEHQLNLTFYGGGSVKLTADSQSGGGDGSKAFIQDKPNTFRLSVSNNVAKLYINDVFSQKVTLTPDLTYTQLLATGIESADALYELNMSGNASIRPQQETTANTDLLNLANSAEGSSLSYGENVIVGMVQRSGVKYLKGTPDNSGKLKFPANLTGNFEVFLTVFEDYCCTEYFDFFLTADEYQINFTFYGGGSIKLATDSQSGSGDASRAYIQDWANKFRLSVSNNVAKLYVNDVFSQKVTLTPDLTYTQLVINGIESADALYNLSTNGNVISNQEETTGETTAEEITEGTVGIPTQCMATYAPDTGRVLIPYIVVPDALGGTTVYSVEMQQQPATFTFDLDFDTVQPR